MEDEPDMNELEEMMFQQQMADADVDEIQVWPELPYGIFEEWWHYPLAGAAVLGTLVLLGKFVWKQDLRGAPDLPRTFVGQVREELQDMMDMCGYDEETMLMFQPHARRPVVVTKMFSEENLKLVNITALKDAPIGVVEAVKANGRPAILVYELDQMEEERIDKARTEFLKEGGTEEKFDERYTVLNDLQKLGVTTYKFETKPFHEALKEEMEKKAARERGEKVHPEPEPEPESVPEPPAKEEKVEDPQQEIRIPKEEEELFSRYMSTAEVCMKKQEFVNAAQCFVAAAAVLRKYAPKSLELALVLHRASELLTGLLRAFQDSLPLAAESINILSPLVTANPSEEVLRYFVASMVNLARTEAGLALWEDAEKHATTAMKLCEPASLETFACLLVKVEACISGARDAEGLELVQDAKALVPKLSSVLTPQIPLHWKPRELEAVLLLGVERVAEAQAVLEQMLADMELHQYPKERVALHMDALGDLALRQGDMKRARELFDKVLQTFEESGNEHYQMLTKSRLAHSIAFQEGDDEAGQALFDEVRDYVRRTSRMDGFTSQNSLMRVLFVEFTRNKQGVVNLQLQAEVKKAFGRKPLVPPGARVRLSVWEWNKVREADAQLVAESSNREWTVELTQSVLAAPRSTFMYEIKGMAPEMGAPYVMVLDLIVGDEIISTLRQISFCQETK